MKSTVHLIAGARPNFMKIAPLYRILRGCTWCEPIFVHTGQHYDYEMSGALLADLELPAPHHHLEVGSGSQAEQTGRIMIAYERLCQSERPDWVIVVGDTNSTIACALTAKKCLLPLAHLEAGLRSRNREMPEEINRVVTDAISDVLWTPSADADENLLREGAPKDAIERVGNIMIDSYEMLRDRINVAPLPAGLDAAAQRFGVVTLHRPANVDNKDELGRIVDALVSVSQRIPLAFPIHPRTVARLKEFDLSGRLARGDVRMIKPLGYIEFMSLLGHAEFVLTDSGGIQEETTYRRIPCLTLRSETERPITLTHGSNRLIDVSGIDAAVVDIQNGRHRCADPPTLWDGKTAGRVAASLHRRILEAH